MDAAASALQPRSGVLDRLGRVTVAQAAILLMLLALAVRTIGLSARPLWLDEAYSAWFSARSWHYLWTVVPTYEPHPPFYYSLLKLWRMVAGGSAVELRSLSLIFSAATVPVVMTSVLELERQRPSGRRLLAAATAGFLTACSPMLVFLDQEARPYPLMILAYAVAVLALLRLMREFREGGAGTWKSWLMLAVATEVELWAHGLGLLYAGCLAVALFPAWIGGAVPRARLIRGTVVAAAVGFAYLPCLLIILGRAGDWGTGWLVWRPIMLLQLFAIYSVPFEAITAGSAVATLVMLLLVKRAVQSAIALPGWNSERALLVLWLGPPLIAALVSQLALPVFLPRTLTAALAPAYVAFGAALARTEGNRERKYLAAAIALTLLPTALQIATRPAPEPWNEVRSYLAAHVATNDEVWLYPNDSALPLDASGPHTYAQRGIPGDYPAVGFKGPIRAGSPAVVSLTHEQAQAIAGNPQFAHVPTIWLVTRQSALFDPQDEFPKALARARRAGPLQHWGYINVQPFYAH
jgi:hypothetical protein